MKEEAAIWQETKDLFSGCEYSFGRHWSYNFKNDPKRLPFVLSRYKFAARMAVRPGSQVLELGCSEGIGSAILAEGVSQYVGIDLDEPSIQSARKNVSDTKFSFLNDDFMEKKYGQFGAVVSLDVIEHILPEFEEQYFSTVYKNLAENGICVIGTPNITFTPYASKASQMGHVNLYSQEKLIASMKKYFHTILPFGMNDEVVHTGFAPMANYLFCIGFDKR